MHWDGEQGKLIGTGVAFIQTKRVSTSGTELYSTRGSTPGNHPPEETVISSSSISPSILELWGTMVSSCTASTVDAWMPSSRSTSEINTGLGNSNTCSPSSCLTVTIMCCRRLNRLMSNSMVDGPLPRSHSLCIAVDSKSTVPWTRGFKSLSRRQYWVPTPSPQEARCASSSMTTTLVPGPILI